MDKLKMHSLDGVERNIELIGKQFPNAITEVMRNGKVEHAIDFDVLRQELSDSIVEGREERYQFTWPDKKKAMLAANAPITATLRPIKADSVGRDGTPGDFDSEHLYIEGDNLEVLKLLQETYLGKVKMIYIDPPYNTGNDFVYEDDFAQSAADYMDNSGQYDEEGNRLVTNTESNGRFHTDWLNMMYPRLRLAKDLLTDDGVIFISIDSKESANLRKVCDEIFGSTCFVCDAIWRSSDNSNNDAKQFSNDYNSTFIYGRNPLWQPQKQDDPEKRRHFKNPDNDPRGPYFDGNPLNSPNYRENLIYDITTPSGNIIHSPKNGWRWSKETLMQKMQTGEIRFNEDETNIKRRTYLCDMEGLPPSNLWMDFEKTGHNRQAKYELLKLLPEDVFDTPKPVRLLMYIMGLVPNSENAIFMDFFSGSGTMADAVFQMNMNDGKKRKYILVQLPENLDESLKKASNDNKKALQNAISLCDKLGKSHYLTEVAKERIRRAGKQILSAIGGQLSMEGVRLDVNSTLNTPNSALDVGFRCLRLDSSNMENVYYTPDEVGQQDLFSLVDNVKEDRTPEDLLFQVMLDLGVLLSSPIEVKEIAGKKVFNVADGFLLACFDHNVTEETVKAIAQMKPYYAVFRDSSMANDSVATNFEQIFETYSPDTVRKVL